MMKYIRVIILATSFLIIGCKSTKEIVREKHNDTISQHTTQAVLWQQHSAEYKALTYQAYNLAKLRLDEVLKENNNNKPLAIVTDIDETVLDNSPYNGKLIKTNTEYSSNTWTEWVSLKSAKPILGALAFFNYATSKGVTVFYISNRKNTHKKETIENLQKFNFPFADAEHVILKDKESGKEPRRKLVQNTHKIVMLLGDNLSDFSLLFDDKSTKDRNELVNDLRNEFGKKFIVFPNPMYGDWETKGIYESKNGLLPTEKVKIKLEKMKSY